MLPQPLSVPGIEKAREHAECCDACYDRIEAYDDLIKRLGEWATYADELQREIDSLKAAQP
jgi:uncharacterized protein Yka (UPF0111/DUF47 family)